MTRLLSSISGKFNVAVVLGTVLPVTIFVIVVWILLPGIFPAAIALPFVEDSQVFSLSLVILILSGLLHHLNEPLIQLVEGYPWENTALGRWGKHRLRKRYDALVARRNSLKALRDWLSAKNNDLPPPFGASDRLAAWDAASTVEGGIRDTLHLQYPTRGSILPTRLGNAIRSFEVYPNQRYGMEAINLWPRLVAKIDGAFADSIESAKASFDFAIHSAALAGALAALLAGARIFEWRRSPTEADWRLWAIEIGLSLLLSMWFYRLSIGRAVAWGSTVRSAFDLYRRDLLSQLGYSHTPRTVAEEKAIWDDISWEVTYGIERNRDYAPPPPPKSGPTFARSSNGVTLRLFRSGEPLADGHLRVSLELSNLDAAQDATEVEVQDTVPEGYDFVMSSAQPTGAFEVSGINPYVFHLKDPVAHGTRQTFTYEIKSRASCHSPTVGGHR